MEEDIEGNGLMYPKIENVFSNANNIKSEPVDYDEDGYDSIELAEYPYPNKIILGSKPIGTTEPIAGTSTASGNWHQFPCDECDTVLSSQDDLDAHKSTHSFLVARSMTIKTTQSLSSCFIATPEAPKRQKAKKSTAKSSILNNTFPLSKSHIQVDESDKLLCDHCDQHFPDEITLMTHKYELLPEVNFVCDICEKGFKSSIALRGHRAVHFRKSQLEDTVDEEDSTTDFIQCMLCSCYLRHKGGVMKHMALCHNGHQKKTKVAKFSGKCPYCAKIILTQRQYNMHVLKIHFYSKENMSMPKTVKFKCTLCDQVFATRYSAAKHKTLKHPNYKKRTTLESIKDSSRQTKTSSLSKNISSIGAPIPKQILFKCNNCQIHFVTCSTALEHSKRCVLAKGDWKCTKCRRTFTHLERPIHTLQHEHSDKFKVHIVNDKIISKVICRCPKCDLHFDENTFWKHVSSGCTTVNGVECNICNLNMHPDSVSKHRKYHNNDDLTRSDYILIEFVDAASQRTSNSPNGKRKLYYCKNCKCNTYTLKNKSFHLSGVCKEKSYKRNCQTCGLLFSTKIYPKHILDHEVKKLSLNDYNFVRIQDDKVINAPLPEFRKCDVCKIRFITALSQKMHTCKKQKYTKCTKCSHKYEPNAYNVHLLFHEYTSTGEDIVPTKIYVYACVGCSYGFHSYDSLVEHCQRHYNDSQVLKTTACGFCKLNYSEEHLVNHRDVKILKFNHDKLLNNDFLDGFKPVSNEEVQSILSQSMYGVIRNVRNVRLNLVRDGPPERSLYKCAQCDLSFDIKNVLEHTKEPCSKSPRYNCNSCNAGFPTEYAASTHSTTHVVFGDDISFREILFNDQSDKELNEALLTGQKKESLKFRTCQRCKQLIKKNDFQRHMEGHDMKTTKMKKVKGKHEKYTIFQANGAKRLYTVYRCILCKADLMKKVNVGRHNCGTRATSERCHQCSLMIRKYFRAKHEAIHKRLPKFVTKNITVLNFQVHNKRKRQDIDETVQKTSSKTLQKTYDTRKSGDKSYADNSTETESEDSQSEVDNPELLVAVNNLDKWKIELKNKLYQCENCYMCFVNKEVLLNHLPNCSVFTEGLTCTHCDITFHPSLVAFHKKLHYLINKTPQENYLYLVSVSFIDDNVPWLYKCKCCDVNYLTYKALGYHFAQNHNNASPYIECETCNLKFTGNSCSRHRDLHHGLSGSNNQFNIEIVDRKVIPTGSMEVVAKDDVNGVKIDEVTESESQGTDCMDNNETETNSLVYEDETSTARDEDNDSSKQDAIDLFKCISCHVHYINRHTLVCHMRRNNRLHKTDSNQCDVCNIEFGLYTLKKHKALHHKHIQNKHNFVINTIEENIFMDDITNEMCDSVNDTENLVDTTQDMEDLKQENLSTQDEVDEKIDVQKTLYAASVDTDDMPLVRLENDIKKIKLYQCKDCRVCVEKTLRKFHVCCSDIQKKYCIQCSLAFKRSDFSGHMRLHRTQRDLSRKNYVLVRFGRRSINNKIFKCVTCSTHFVDMQTLQWHMDVFNHQTKRVYCETCGLFFGKFSLKRHVFIHHKKLKLTTEQFDIISVSNDTASNIKAENSAQITSVETSKVVEKQHSKTFKKLFKCFECDVYLLSQSAYYKHMYNHVELDPTEYIACKMCDMQFLTEDLGVHMKSHRDKTFNLDNLIIEGYQPRSESPRIESYLAVDGLNSKLVSTTTISDNEEDVPKNEEQLSTVDSTSAKLQ